MSRSAGHLGAIAALAVLASAPAAWWFAGADGGVADDLEPDYLWQPLRMSTTVERTSAQG